MRCGKGASESETCAQRNQHRESITREFTMPENDSRAVPREDGVTAPEVSIIIPCHCSENPLRNQINSLVNQEGAPPFEVIIADNGAPEDLHPLVTRYREGGLDIRIVDATGRRGVCHARNIGVLHSHAPVVCFADADDVAAPRWVAAMTARVRPGVLVTGSLAYDAMNPSWLVEALGLTGRMWSPEAYLGYLPFAYGCSLAIMKDDYIHVGGMDESILGGSDDVEFSWRAQESGLKLVHAPDAVMHYALRNLPRTAFQQKRSYQRADVLVWSRSVRQHRPVEGKSFRWSLAETFAAFMHLPLARRGGRISEIQACVRAGGALGSLEGHIRYRILGQAPAPLLWHY